jgi:hypothetical protein
MRDENDRMNCALPLHPVHLPENGRICTAMRAAACRKTMSGEVGRTAGRVSMKTMQGNAQGLGMFRTVVGITTIGVLHEPDLRHGQDGGGTACRRSWQRDLDHRQ